MDAAAVLLRRAGSGPTSARLPTGPRQGLGRAPFPQHCCLPSTPLLLRWVPVGTSHGHPTLLRWVLQQKSCCPFLCLSFPTFKWGWGLCETPE